MRAAASSRGPPIRTGTFNFARGTSAATADPANPLAFRPDYNITDKLHPNDAGYQAMANAVDLSLFK